MNLDREQMARRFACVTPERMNWQPWKQFAVCDGYTGRCGTSRWQHAALPEPTDPQLQMDLTPPCTTKPPNK